MRRVRELEAVVIARDLGERRRLLTDHVRAGRLVRAYPGVYVDPARRRDPEVRVRAAAATNPDGLFIGNAAQFLLGLAELDSRPLVMTGPRALKRSDLTIVGGRPDPRWRLERHGVAVAHPALNAAYLAAEDGGAAIDDFLRRGGDLGLVQSAASELTRWPGHRERSRVIAASRSHPWSMVERRYHQLLWAAGIDGWRANYPVRVGDRRFFLDVAFARERVGLEFDGFEVHSRRAVFESDRERHNLLVLDGWLVLRFTWFGLERPDLFVAQVRSALAQRGTQAA